MRWDSSAVTGEEMAWSGVHGTEGPGAPVAAWDRAREATGGGPPKAQPLPVINSATPPTRPPTAGPGPRRLCYCMSVVLDTRVSPHPLAANRGCWMCSDAGRGRPGSGQQVTTGSEQVAAGGGEVGRLRATG